jgi:hypothetical protein
LPAFGAPARTTRGSPPGLARATSNSSASASAARAPARRSSISASGTWPVSRSSKSRLASHRARRSSRRSRSAVDPLREPAGEQRGPGAALAVVARADEGQHALRAREVDPPGEERAARELAGLGRDRAERQHARQRGVEQRRGAGQVELGDVLARERARRRHPQEEQRLLARAVEEPPDVESAPREVERLRHSATSPRRSRAPSVPEIRTSPRAPPPGGDAMAAMVVMLRTA